MSTVTRLMCRFSVLLSRVCLASCWELEVANEGVHLEWRSKSEALQNIIVLEKSFDILYSAIVEAQSQSRVHGVEFCGYVVKNEENVERAVGPIAGERYFCRTPIVYEPDELLFSFHTHGAEDETTLAEFPSETDFEAVQSEGIDAFVGTPRGKLWHISANTLEATLLCSEILCERFVLADESVAFDGLPTILDKETASRLAAAR